jgi:hypothetical protein
MDDAYRTNALIQISRAVPACVFGYSDTMDNLRVPPHDAGGEMLQEMFKTFLQSYRYYGDVSDLTPHQRC